MKLKTISQKELAELLVKRNILIWPNDATSRSLWRPSIIIRPNTITNGGDYVLEVWAVDGDLAAKHPDTLLFIINERTVTFTGLTTFQMNSISVRISGRDWKNRLANLIRDVYYAVDLIQVSDFRYGKGGLSHNLISNWKAITWLKVSQFINQVSTFR